jgi:hypothetical protein
MTRIILLSKRITALFFCATLAACGSGSQSPLSPSGPDGTGSAAIISGSVLGGGSSSLTSAGSGHPITGLTVSIVGTSVTATVDGAGRFTLTAPNAGDLQLRFSGGGVETVITLSDVRTSQSISLVVSITGSTANLETVSRTGAGEDELEGRVESLPPTTSARSFRVAGKTVTTTDSTRFEQGGDTRSFSDLEIGMRVHVKGDASSSSVAASLVRIQNTNTTIPVNVNGVIDSLTGSAAAFEFKIGSRVVKGDTFTQWFGDGDSPDSFASLEDGARVEVKGQQRDGYIYASRIHITDSDDDDDDDDDDQDQSASIQGTLTAISGSAPSMTLTVGGTTVRTTAGTDVNRRGDTQSLDTLRVGQTLHVVGERQADGSIDARHIRIEDDATGGEFEIEGSAGGVKGTCPALTFSVNGFDIRTSAATTFEGGTCATLKSGTKVNVKGLRAADGSTDATRVKFN